MTTPAYPTEQLHAFQSMAASLATLAGGTGGALRDVISFGFVGGLPGVTNVTVTVMAPDGVTPQVGRSVIVAILSLTPTPIALSGPGSGFIIPQSTQALAFGFVDGAGTYNCVVTGTTGDHISITAWDISPTPWLNVGATILP